MRIDARADPTQAGMWRAVDLSSLGDIPGELVHADEDTGSYGVTDRTGAPVEGTLGPHRLKIVPRRR